MKTYLNSQEMALVLATISRCDLEKKENEFEFTVKSELWEKRQFTIKIDELETIRKNLKDKKISQGQTAIYSKFEYEILIDEGWPLNFQKTFLGKILSEDQRNGLTYEISQLSNEYLLWLIERIPESDLWVKSLMSRNSAYSILMLGDVIQKSESLFDYIKKRANDRLLTLKINSQKSIEFSKFQELSSALLFNLGHNFDIVFIPKRSFVELSRKNKESNSITLKKEICINFPSVTYKSELVHYYLSAISSNDRAFQYLSFYHIIEHFFFAVSEEKIVEKVKSELQSQNFSNNSDSDVKALIKAIRDDKTARSEKNSLTLCLEKYLGDFSELICGLDEFSLELVDYYKTKPVSFSGGSVVDLSSVARDKIAQKLADRIYKTRNSIVHKKDGDLNVYSPFSDEISLLKEIPLIRCIAEIIVLSNTFMI